METRLVLIILSWFLVAIACLTLGACAVISQPRFGKLPEGSRLEAITQSPNYKEGTFQYPLPTPLFSQDVSTFSVILGSLFGKNDRLVPDTPIPAVKTDLKALDPQQDVVIWLGHSSWYIQLDGRRILIDPILSDYAAPFSFMNKAFAGTSIYQAEDIPAVDYLLISHDHWDHLDYSAAVALQAKVKRVVCPLGVGAYFEYWGYPKEAIREGDWNDSVVDGDFIIHLLPARHYSGRVFSKNKTLWAAFALTSAKRRIFFSGDSGYGPHFSEIGREFDGFDLVMLDCGQYDPRWSYIHMNPEEAVQAAQGLGAKTFIPAHVGRFTIANHAWDEPFKRVADASRGKSYRLLTPEIGEPVAMDVPASSYSQWWLEIGESHLAQLSAQ